MALGIRTVLILAFLFASGAPLAVYWLWPHSAVMANKADEIRERHFLLAKNLGFALESYHRDLIAVFGSFAPEIATGEADEAKPVFNNLHFRHVCVADPTSGRVLRQYFATTYRCPAVIPAERLAQFNELAANDGVSLSNVVVPDGEEPRIYIVTRYDGVLVVGAIKTTFFKELQKRISFGRKGHAAIVDRSGRVSDLLTRTLGTTIKFSTNAAPDLWKSLADPGQVENAPLNLAIKARGAMPNGGKLTIECANVQLDEASLAGNPEAMPGDYVVLAVSDEGTGMTPEVLAQAFEPFFTTKEVGAGSGLGLSMVYGFAKQSGGHVSIYSEEGRGTTVRLYLPRAAEARLTKSVIQDSGKILLDRGEVILVIEDDPDVRALAVQMLENLRYQVIDVGDVASAHKVLAVGHPVGLVLSDVVLPGGSSGPQFAEAARAIYPGIKIIFMSGHPAEAAMRNGFLGSDQVLLNKPFQRGQLATVLREALG